MKTIFRVIYRQPLLGVIIFIAIGVWVWGMANRNRQNKYVQRFFSGVNGLFFLVGCGIILYSTVLGRTPGKVEICLIPFYTLYLAHEQPEMYRSMLMNILLFVPYGMSMPYILPKSFNRRIVSTVLSAIVLSLAIEVVQYVFRIGWTEIDDVICNTLGTTVGCFSYLISVIPQKPRNTMVEANSTSDKSCEGNSIWEE